MVSLVLNVPLMAAFDLDGTLFNRSAELSQHTVETLDQLSGPGRHFVAATGRSHRSAARRLAPAKPMKWAVCDNGAVLYDLHSTEIVEYRAIDGPFVRQFVSELSTQLPDVEWAWESLAEGFYWTHGFSTMTTLPKPKWVEVGRDTPPPDDVLKLYLAHPDTGHKELKDLVHATVPNPLAITTSGAEFLEATAPGVTKASMLDNLCQRLGVPVSNTIAFGDSLNDLEMLAWAAAGYAMANAHPDAKAVAYAVTPLDHENNGVADVLASLLG